MQIRVFDEALLTWLWWFGIRFKLQPKLTQKKILFPSKVGKSESIIISLLFTMG